MRVSLPPLLDTPPSFLARAHYRCVATLNSESGVQRQTVANTAAATGTSICTFVMHGNLTGAGARQSSQVFHVPSHPRHPRQSLSLIPRMQRLMLQPQRLEQRLAQRLVKMRLLQRLGLRPGLRRRLASKPLDGIRHAHAIAFHLLNLDLGKWINEIV